VLDFSAALSSSDIDAISPRLSDAFAKVRQIRGLAIETSAAALGVTPRELRAIESGSAHPDPEMIARMADHYRIDADRLGTDVMIRPSDPGIDPDQCIIWFGWLPIEYGSNLGSNHSILNAVADGIRLLRSVGPTSSVRLRSKELDLVMTLLDLNDEHLIRDAVRAFRLPWKQTEELIAASIERVRTKSLVSQASSIIELQANEPL
jgi:transcriptional regulator with XRE-family HTH domain